MHSWGNAQFTPGKKDEGFRTWNMKCFQKLINLYEDGVLLSFDQLCLRYKIHVMEF